MWDASSTMRYQYIRRYGLTGSPGSDGAATPTNSTPLRINLQDGTSGLSGSLVSGIALGDGDRALSARPITFSDPHALADPRAFCERKAEAGPRALAGWRVSTIAPANVQAVRLRRLTRPTALPRGSPTPNGGPNAA